MKSWWDEFGHVGSADGRLCSEAAHSKWGEISPILNLQTRGPVFGLDVVIVGSPAAIGLLDCTIRGGRFGGHRERRSGMNDEALAADFLVHVDSTGGHNCWDDP